MPIFLGVIIVASCVFGGYYAMGGNLNVLFQPWEYVIVVGALAGGFTISNPPKILRQYGFALGATLRGPRYGRAAFLELLTLLMTVFRFARSKGINELEKHFERPFESEIFTQYPQFMNNKFAREFFCDTLRLVSMGSENKHELDSLTEEEVSAFVRERHKLVNSMRYTSDSAPAVGIVAAVLGVIKTMGAISEPPEVLGRLMAGALVGTFSGILLSYGFLGPLANAMESAFSNEEDYVQCIRSGLLAHVAGSAPPISVEFARKALPPNVRPSFEEVENAVSK